MLHPFPGRNRTHIRRAESKAIQTAQTGYTKLLNVKNKDLFF